ncbi:hypothetical protein N7510_011054 [Penicillium lagena]|uniref:uncharacterized protein n=1 Tax=Penicillium lagena TaxID=94218 RepID=UPI00254007C6|nr:uncharacterized protein N7510_011054 [Penicillium lagena]KAJ5601520.1 hypothetical protein N7510_011054 [Penicillium lagena]
MWSKGPFHRSKNPSIGNPTLVDRAAVENRFPSVKDLPSLPNGSSLPAHDDMTRRHSDVSPLVSPNLYPTDHRSSVSISPIEETAPPFFHERKVSQNTPLAAKPVPPPPAEKPIRLVKRDQPTRWDVYSGEPTNNDAGKAGQVNPTNTTFHKSTGSSLFSWGREQFHPKKKLAEARSRISTFSKNEPPPPPAEPRNRSSSHTHLASWKRASATDASPQLSSIGFTPSVTTTITGGAPPQRIQRPATAETASSGRHTPRQQQQYEPDPQFEAAIANMMISDEPRSRFSATTYTATEIGSQTQSPRDSGNFDTQSTDDFPSVMARTRPVPGGMPSSKKPVRKPTPSQSGPEQPQPAEAIGEQTPEKRIASLEARRTDIQRRRHNLETMVHELTQVIQPSSIAYDLAAKAEVKKTVSSIENEIADLKREEHEIGLKVARAWRRLDETENAGDGSCLWIKRVTS